jgi:histone acetyltransferase SAS3
MSPSKNGSGKASPSLNGQITPGGTINLRRTRSRLAENVVNGVDNDEVPEGDAVSAVNGYHTRSRSGTGSPKHANGKGKAPANEGDADEDAHGETDDPDAEGEMDIDAEGEYDDGNDVVMTNA